MIEILPESLNVIKILWFWHEMPDTLLPSNNPPAVCFLVLIPPHSGACVRVCAAVCVCATAETFTMKKSLRKICAFSVRGAFFLLCICFDLFESFSIRLTHVFLPCSLSLTLSDLALFSRWICDDENFFSFFVVVAIFARYRLQHSW